MDEMSREEFERLKNTAAQKMREIGNRQSAGSPSPFPDFVRVPTRAEKPPEQEEKKREVKRAEKPPVPPQKMGGRLGGFLKNINLTEMLKDKDSLLILGLIFLLSNEDADESLMMALAYILL